MDISQLPSARIVICQDLGLLLVLMEVVLSAVKVDAGGKTYTGPCGGRDCSGGCQCFPEKGSRASQGTSGVQLIGDCKRQEECHHKEAFSSVKLNSAFRYKSTVPFYIHM